jgi:predicted nucleic acid-binding protein
MTVSALLTSQDVGSWDADRARGEARDILSERPFREVSPPRPLRGLFESIGETVRRAFDAVVDVFPGGESALWAFLGLVAVAIAVVVARSVIKRRTRAGKSASRPAIRTEALDPRSLEREADEAERAGHLERAIRLRFRAGLLRLDEAGRIDWRPSMTTGQVAAKLARRDFDEVTRIFEEIVYGRRRPVAPDVTTSKAGWESVLT